ncbi:MAG: hypothetical protein MZV63_39795 [Marinilabiliales bacterium]|nr:hypothetical protein [Marinilabiliales bacterium]
MKEKELIAQQIAKQKEELTLKNKNITDSIVYAKKNPGGFNALNEFI